jgi:diguanylate cyclase (GGDEF)-like protein
MHQEHLRVLLVEDQPVLRAHLVTQLRALGHDVIEAENAQLALAHFHEHQPDLVLLDVVLPDQDGYWLARQFRRQEGSRWTPIIFLSCMTHETDLQQGIDAGGDDYLTKPVSPIVLRSKLLAMQRLLYMRNQLTRATEELRTANYRLAHLSSHDELTGLGNRRGLDERLNQYIGQARRDRLPLTLIMCDVDHFKRYNDSLGHLEGDRCLQHISGVMAQACRRPLDYVARYGGEEFAILLPNTPADGALTMALALLHNLRANAVEHPDSPLGPYVTLSGGITTCIAEDTTTAQSLIRQADESLYAAKTRGRNRFVDLDAGLDTNKLLSGQDGVAPAMSTATARAA